MIKLTGHMLVKNEENWIWFAISSILPYLDQLIIFDTGSTDKTIDIIETFIKDTKNDARFKIKFYKKPINSRGDIVKRRQEMVELTKTDWFLLVDGDEVWTEKSLKLLTQSISVASEDIYGIVVRTRNCVGDIFHYQPESAGQYHLKGRTGHLTIRAYRQDGKYQWKGEYPLEGYIDKQGNLLNDQDDKLLFVDTYYYHLTHLKRSGAKTSAAVIDRVKKYKYEVGLSVYEDEVPTVFSLPQPDIVPNPLVGYAWWEKILASLATPLKSLKRRR